MRNVAAILPLKFKLSEKFQHFNAINRCIEMIKMVEFPKISIKIKNCQTFCKAQTANCLKTFIQSPPIPPPSSTRTNLTMSQKQILLKEIYGNIQTFAFKVLQECSSWASRNGVVQIFFLTPQRSMFLENLSERFLAVFQEHIVFNVK